MFLHEFNGDPAPVNYDRTPTSEVTEKRKVHIVGGYDYSVGNVFPEEKYDLVKDIKAADIVVWTGGADIGSYLYGEEPLPYTHAFRNRDALEVDAFNNAPKGALLVGICRGGQLLNVLSGGSMHQHVDNHGSGHLMEDLRTGAVVRTSSLHHQMMRPADNAVIICVADRSSYRLGQNHHHQRGPDYEANTDPEVVWYPNTRSLCFQGHPEYGPKECTEYFLDLIDDFYDVDLPLPSH